MMCITLLRGCQGVRTAKRFHTKAQGKRLCRATLGLIAVCIGYANGVTHSLCHRVFNSFGVTGAIWRLTQGAPFARLRSTLGFGVERLWRSRLEAQIRESSFHRFGRP
jgi:hypothetical protein